MGVFILDTVTYRRKRWVLLVTQVWDVWKLMWQRSRPQLRWTPEWVAGLNPGICVYLYIYTHIREKLKLFCKMVIGISDECAWFPRGQSGEYLYVTYRYWECTMLIERMNYKHVQVWIVKDTDGYRGVSVNIKPFFQKICTSPFFCPYSSLGWTFHFCCQFLDPVSQMTSGLPTYLSSLITTA